MTQPPQQDVDHDVYTFGLPQLVAAKRKLAEDGVVALFLGFGQYKVSTCLAFLACGLFVWTGGGWSCLPLI